MATTTNPPAATNPPAQAPENGTVARPAPAPAPAADATDEELRKSMEAEAQEVEQEEESLTATDDATTEPEEEDGEEVAEEEDQVSVRLLGAVKEVTDEIEECDSIIEQADNEYNSKIEQAEAERNALVEKTETRREELKVQLQNAINKMQSKYGMSPKVRRTTAKASASAPAKKTNGRHDKSIRVLITEYLEKHRHARTSEIRSFLQSQGRTTNPGVELSRMVKDGSIVNKERGMYTLPRGK